MRQILLALAHFCFCLSLLGAEPVSIGVYDVKAAGGTGGQVDGLIRGLKGLGFPVDTFSDFQPLTLAQFDIVYLSDMHRPGRVHKDWRKYLLQFIRSGGGVLQTWHHHILPDVSVGVRRVFNSRRMHIVTGHPAVQGLADFNAAFKDHIVEKVGKQGVPVLKNDAGDVVAAAGKLGKGKVISTGLALAMPQGRGSRPPRGTELALLKAFLKWLRPEVTRDVRLARILKEPRLEVSPVRALTAAGYPAVFQVKAAVPGPPGLRVSCAGGSVAEIKRPGQPEQVRQFRVTVPAAEGGPSEKRLYVAMKAGEVQMKKEVQVAVVSGPVPKNEVRGVWLHVGMDRHPKKVMPELKKLGINMAVPRIAGGTAAFYASKVQPDIQDPLAPGGDWLAESVKYAHANQVELHPYVNVCVVEGRTSKESLARLEREGRLQLSWDGRTIPWFCPSQEVNLAAMERVLLEIATRYKVDGIQYDFIRYNNDRGCYCEHCRALFEKAIGRKIEPWPQNLMESDLASEWIEFRCGRISALVERVSGKIRKQAPKVRISAAVFRDWPDCRKSVGQDWVRWCKEGWLDFVCPMNYTMDNELFEKRCEIHQKALPEGFPVVEGIGIASGAGRMNDPARVAVQIAIARKHRAAGFLGFCYLPSHTTGLLSPLHDWLARQPSKAP